MPNFRDVGKEKKLEQSGKKHNKIHPKMQDNEAGFPLVLSYKSNNDKVYRKQH